MEKETKKQTQKGKTLYQKILQIQENLRAFKKDKKAFNYEYVTGDKLLTFIRPWMDELGLLLLPSVKEFTHEPVKYQAYVTDRNGGGKVVEKMEILASIMIDFTWVDTATGETLTQSWAGSGMNAFDKGFGSALTYAERYFLLKTFHIATDRDDVDYLAATRDAEIEGADTAPVSTPEAPAPSPVKESKEGKPIRTIEEGDPFIENVVAWVLRQNNYKAAIQQASIGYKWNGSSLQDFLDKAEEAKQFKDELTK